MARHFFGLGPADFAMQAVGVNLQLVPNAVGTAWDSLAGGSPITDLQDQSFASVTTIVADGNGRIGFYGPDTICSLFVDFGFSRFLLAATDLGPQIDANTAGVAANAAGIAGKLSLTGGTMTGPLVLSGTTVSVIGAASTSAGINAQVTADTQQRLIVDASGTHTWGTGAAVGDVTLSRSAVGVLATNGTWQGATLQGGSGAAGTLVLSSTSNPTKGKILVGTSAYDEANNRWGVGKNNPAVPLDVVGAAAISGNATIGGDLLLVGGTTIYRNKLSASATVANTVAEMPLAVATIPAGDAVVGAVYRIKAWGTLAVVAATTPNITFQSRLGGVAGTQMVGGTVITVRSGAADGKWDAEFLLSCVTTGVSGTWAPLVKYAHNFLTSVTTYTPVGPLTLVPQPRDTTIANDMVVSAIWNAAAAGNTITCQGFIAERLA